MEQHASTWGDLGNRGTVGIRGATRQASACVSEQGERGADSAAGAARGGKPATALRAFLPAVAAAPAGSAAEEEHADLLAVPVLQHRALRIHHRARPHHRRHLLGPRQPQVREPWQASCHIRKGV
jgi:hypothetical protein